jgi:2-polyprenyl-3-methyl-5-hydroxy-6-metoxy-1,4-benzoquinol methylase
MKVDSCIFCDSSDFEEVFSYDAPPRGETYFDFIDLSTYSRKVIWCQDCGHFYNVHEMDLSQMYEGEYVDNTYKGGMNKVFDKINALPPERSDNIGRVNCVLAFAKSRGLPEIPDLLDVGSGLAVFPFRMKEAGWNCTALDPDARAGHHARDLAGVRSITGIFGEVEIREKFDVITFNKVLEHVPEPIEMLGHAANLLKPDGFVYIELPDGEEAVKEGEEREEFSLDHYHVFSKSSIGRLCRHAGFQVLEIERLREPSNKFTLRAFIKKSN